VGVDFLWGVRWESAEAGVGEDYWGVRAWSFMDTMDYGLQRLRPFFFFDFVLKVIQRRTLAWFGSLSDNGAVITFLQVKLVDVLPTQVVIDVRGVGYEVLIPLSSFDKLPSPGQEVTLLTHLAIREDAHVLYGFMTAAERDLFRLLINTVSGIGPKIALNVLSGMNVTTFRGAVANGDVKSLSQISGVGKKTAERIVVELKDKIG